ncbi:MAG: DMT family transporter [Bacteroidota bacterium]
MRPVLYLIVATIFWGLNFHLVKIMLLETNAFTAGFWRYLFAVPVLLIFAWKEPLLRYFKHPQAVVWIGIVGLFGFNYFFFTGMKYTAAINGALIISLNPVVTLIVSRIILKTAITWLNVLGILIAFFGVVILLTKGNLLALSQIEFNQGDVYIWIANILFSINHVMVKKHAAVLPVKVITTSSALVCLVCFAIAFPITSPMSVGMSGTYWISTIVVGIGGTSISFYLWNQGINRLGAPTASLFMNFVPVFAGLSSFFFGESLQFYHLLSLIIVIVGLLTMNLQAIRTFSLKHPKTA